MLAAALAWTILLAPIDWRAPTSCPDAAAVERRARALGPEIASLQLHGAVSVVADGTFVLELAIGDAPARRYVARDCDALADIAALVLAVASDPISVSTHVGPAPPARENDVLVPPVVGSAAAPSWNASPRDPAVAPVLRPRPRARPRVRPRVGGFARVHGLFGIGELPRFDAGVGLAVGIGAGLGRFELHAAHLFARTAALPGPGDAAASIASWNLSPRACAVLGRRSVRAALCAGPELGIVTADGRGLADTDRVLALWVAAIAAPGLEWAMTPWLRLHAGVELIAALRRPQFAARERPDDRLTLGPGGLRATLGFAGHFGPGARVRTTR
jgi:hypothetical protein